MTDTLLLLAQIDDASGELLARVMQQLGEIGAKNTQLLANLSRKGRPGHTLLIDIAAEHEDAAAAILVGELGVWGYRILHSEHKHFDTQTHNVQLEVATPEGTLTFPLRVKRIYRDNMLVRVKAEHDDLAHICDELAKIDAPHYLTTTKARIETAVETADVPDTLHIDLC